MHGLSVATLLADFLRYASVEQIPLQLGVVATMKVPVAAELGAGGVTGKFLVDIGLPRDNQDERPATIRMRMAPGVG